MARFSASATSFTNTVKTHRTSYPAIDPTLPALSAAGKTVVVTGGGQGIGLSIALGFADAGASHVVLLGRTLATLTAGRAKIEESHPRVSVHAFAADVTDAVGLSSAFARIGQEVGAIDVCVSSAGRMPQVSAIGSASMDDWFGSFELMVRGSLDVAREFLKHKAEKDAVFISLSSSAAQSRYIPGFSAYAVSKVAMATAVQYLQAENEGVRFLSVHPGVIESDMSRGTEKDYGVKFDFDDYALPGHFCVWATSPAADFLSGRYVWAAWDVDELVARKGEILEKDLLRFGLLE